MSTFHESSLKIPNTTNTDPIFLHLKYYSSLLVRRSASKFLDSASTDPNPFFGRGPDIWRLMGVMIPSLGTA